MKGLINDKNKFFLVFALADLGGTVLFNILKVRYAFK